MRRGKATRRQFLKQATSVSAGAVGLPYIVPASALGKDGNVAPSNRLVLGSIGTGGMGTGDMRSLMSDPGVQCVAVCDVETAHKGHEAILMVRYRIPYDAIIADIRLPDMTGYELLVKLQELMDSVPLILMTGFGYDPGHSIVNARRAGLHPKAILYKPFRLDQLLETVETILDVHEKVQKV